MSCSYADWDGAYVLGALSPADRLEFERHLRSCDDCAAAVRDLAGLPGLLGRVDESAVAEPAPDDVLPPLPDTLLPRLRREIRSRTRRRLVGTGMIAASAAAAVVLAFPVVDGLRGSPTPSTPSVAAAARPMTVLRGGPMRASLALESVAWGTRLHLRCTYAPTAYPGRRAGTYTLLLHTTGGAVERVGTWRPVAGQAMRLSAATAVSRRQIASVEVRTAQGQPVLRLNG